MRKKILCILMSLLFVLALVPTSIFAGNTIESKNVDLVAKYNAHIAANEEVPNPNVKIDYPSNLAIFYRGETIKYKTHGTNPYYNENGGGQRSGWQMNVAYYNSNNKYIEKCISTGIKNEITTKQAFSFTGSYKTKGFYPKDGVFMLISMVFEENAEEADCYCANGYALLTLKRPTKVKATAGKKRVTISYKKA